MELVVRPIGFVRSPFREKVEAPRQAVVAADATATLEVLPAYEDALADLAGFDRIWLVFWFHDATHYRPKVQPPRSDEKRGLFATRSPHRPNPIGLSAVRLERVERTTLHLREIDLIDGTPVLDIKPYIPYADAFPDASSGWLAPKDPRAVWEVAVEAMDAVAWVEQATGLDLGARIVAALSLGPQPHAYRRIRELSDGTRVLAVKEWRVHFRVDGQRLVVTGIASGFRPKELLTGKDAIHETHRAFAEKFPLS